MTDEVLKELWDTKDRIAKEHGYSIDGLAEYYIKKSQAKGRTNKVRLCKQSEPQSEPFVG